MSYVVDITDTTTGETREWDSGLEWVEHSDYLWEEGNFSCDCNRSLFFGRAIDTPEDEIEEAPCGGLRYTVSIRVGKKIVYSD